MADEILEETQTEGTTETTPLEGTTEGTQTEGTTGNGYLTKPYLVRNLQTFWGKIKQYITNQKFVNEDIVKRALLSKADQSVLDSLEDIVDGKAEVSDLESLRTTVTDKVSQDELTERLAGKVDAVEGKGLSEENFTSVLKTKLENLKDSVVTQSDPGLMSAADKKKLDRLVENAVTEVDEALSETSTNPVQNKIINEALNGKVDKETLDPSEVFNQDLRLVESTAGDIVFEPSNTIKHIKLHTEKGEIIEKFYISGTNNSDKTEIFDTFKTSDRAIRIPNPDGENKPANAVYKFYVECLEFSGSGKYKPFILKVRRDSDNPISLDLDAFES